MNLHEYQSKELLKQFGVKVPEGIMIETPNLAAEAAEKIKNKTGINSWAIKAQIHSGGRGKAGGIKIANSIDQVVNYTHHLIGSKLITHQTEPTGKWVRKVLIEQNIYYKGENEIKEFYVSILLNRQKSKYVFVYSAEGGMEIETVADKMPERIFEEEVDPIIGFMPFQARKIAFNLQLKSPSFTQMINFLLNLWKAFQQLDASLIEINPVVKTSDEHIYAADAKIIIDDNSLIRHPELEKLRDWDEEEPLEIEATQFGLNFVKLSGNVGCMVNGAGLAMATMDIIKLSGGHPANFLDVGGAANAKTVEAGFRIILKDPNIKAIFINIFGGIVRCDRVAQGVIDAYKNIGNIQIPIIVRLQGTNATEAKKLIDNSGLKVLSATTLEEAASLVKKEIE